MATSRSSPVAFDLRSRRIEELLPDAAAYGAVYVRLPAWRRRKCDALRLPDDRRRSVAAWLLLRQMLVERGFAADDLEVSENAFGKPVFASLPDVHFSLSHAGERVMALLAAVPVGCDVERIVPLQEGVAEACLTSAEKDWLLAVPSGPERDRAFCRLWVRKESYVKARGEGLSLGLGSFSVLSGKASPYEFRDLDFGDGHLGCTCVPVAS